MPKNGQAPPKLYGYFIDPSMQIKVNTHLSATLARAKVLICFYKR